MLVSADGFVHGAARMARTPGGGRCTEIHTHRRYVRGRPCGVPVHATGVATGGGSAADIGRAATTRALLAASDGLLTPFGVSLRRLVSCEPANVEG